MSVEVVNLVTGAGGATVLMWLWLSSEKKQREGLQKKLDTQEEEAKEITQKVIEALILNKQFLEAHRNDLEKLGTTVKDEMDKLSRTLTEARNEILKERN